MTTIRERSRTRFAVAAPVAFAIVSAWAGDSDPVASFLQHLYAPYTEGAAPNPTGAMAPSIFTPALLALIRKDQRLAQGEAGVLDHDPICGCQDYDALRSLSISVPPHGDDRASGIVSFNNGSQQVTIKFQMIQIGGQWRIDDITEDKTSSLRLFLEKGIADYKKRKP